MCSEGLREKYVNPYTDFAFKKGEAKGRVEGRAEGERDKARIIARNLKNTGLSIDEIAAATGLPADEIKEL